MQARRWFLGIAAAAVPFAVCLFLIPLRSFIPSADVAVAAVGAAAVAGTLGGAAAPCLASFSAAAAFDLFWTEPYGSLQMDESANRLTGVVVLVVGLVLATLLRRRLQLPRRRHHWPWWGRRLGTEHLRTVGRVAEDIADGGDAGVVVVDVARTLVDVLNLKDCWFEVPPFAVIDGDRPVLVRPGELKEQGVRWDPSLIGLPEVGCYLPVVAHGRMAGRFVCLPHRRQPVPMANILVALTLGDQVASALLLAAAV